MSVTQEPATARSAAGSSSTGAALAGMVATAGGVATAEAVAALTVLVPSPLDVLGQLVITALPGGLLTGAIGLFGTANRLVLTAASLLVALALGALVGRLAARSWPGAVTAVVLVALGTAIASLTRPEAAFPLVLLTLAAAATLTTLLLARLLHHLGLLPRSPSGTVPTPTDPPVDRRAFLRLGMGASLAAAAVGGLARRAGGGGGGGGAVMPTVPDASALTPDVSLPPITAAQDLARTLDGVSPVITPLDRFFRIDTAVLLPRAELATWQLRVSGAVERELVLSYDDLLARDLVEMDATIACVSNEVGGSLIGTARWTGVPLEELLEEAGPTAGAEQVLGRSIDGFTAGFPLEVALDGRQPLVAVGMNGEALPQRHGFPARLIVPGLYGYVSATKWLQSIELTSWEDVDGYWIPRGWSKEAPVKTSARIDVPTMDAEVAAGPVVVAGVAWAPTRGITEVEVLVDGDPATLAELSVPLAAATWVQWRAEVDLAPGEHRLTVRATDGEGRRQPEGPASPAPNGAEGWHTIRVRAA
ncbi:MAG: molybdopterin-dependent oxidoreductase [Nitriliruptoraceae bacterium]